jgi:uncharacterized small protein (DUF1192 family)
MKKLIILLISIVCLFVLVGCANNEAEYNSPSDGMEETESKEVITSINRKIIFEVNASMNTDDLSETVSLIRSYLEEDEWFDEEKISNENAYLKIRIKSTRLDAFISSLSSFGEVGDYTKIGTDVSLKYQDNTNRITTLEAELARLNDLYEMASISDMIEINSRISVINTEIAKLNGELNQFDSLVDYSVVNLNINEASAKETTPFWKSVKKAFVGGWNALLTLLQFLVIALSALLPFAIIIVPVVGISLLVIHHNKKKRNSKN